MTDAAETCSNCGTALAGAYCQQCGQRADEPRRVVIGLVQDFLVDTFAIDGKLARSILLLYWRPATLARRYLDGRRVHYSPPFRLYLFASVFFFIAIFSSIGALGNKEEDAASGAPEAVIAEDVIGEVAESDPATAEMLNSINEDVGEAAEKDIPFTEKSWDDDVEYNGPDWLEPYIKRMYEGGQHAVEDPRLFLAQTKDTLPRVLLLAPVLYALLLMGLYFYRRKYYVYDHFVVSLYMHAALYAYLLAALILSLIPVIGSWLAAPLLIWGWLQPFLVFRQAYRSNWVSAFLKWLVSITIYFTLLIIIITLGFSYSLYQS